MSAAVMTHRFMNGTATDFFAPAGPMSSAILRIVICFSVHGYGPGRELDSSTRWARPSAFPSVTLRWYRPITRVEDLTTGEVFTVAADGSWSSGFGGSSTKRENGLQTARIFKLIP